MSSPNGIALAILSVSVAACSKPGAAPGGSCLDRWSARYGSLEASAPGCASFVGTSARREAGAPGVNTPTDYFAGAFDWKTPVSAHLDESARFSRPVADAESPVELTFRGGSFGVAKGKYFFWESERHWTDWKPAPTWTEGENKLRVRQNGRQLEGFVNDALVGTFTLEAEPGPGPVGVSFKSRPDAPAKVQVRDYQVTDLK